MEEALFKRHVLDILASELQRSSKYSEVEKIVDEVLKSPRKLNGSPLQSASKHEKDNFMEALLGNELLVSKLEPVNEYNRDSDRLSGYKMDGYGQMKIRRGKRYRLGLYDCISSYCGEMSGYRRGQCIVDRCHQTAFS